MSANKFILSSLCLLAFLGGYAQVIQRSVLSSAGGTLSGGGNQITFTIGQTVTPTLSTAGNVLTQGFQQPGEQVKTGAVPTAICAGSNLTVPYNAIDIGAGNTFSAQLSDANGSFASPVTIGTLPGNASGNINAQIPPGTTPGNGYRIRVVSSSPVAIGNDNGTGILIGNSAPPAITGPVNVCQFVGTGAPVTFTCTTAGVSGYNWILPPNVNIVSGAGTANLTVSFAPGFATQGNKQIRLTTSSACGTSPLSIYYLAAQLPITPQPITGPVSACPFIGTGTATYSIPAVTAATNYNWTVPAGATIQSGQGTTSITVSFSNSYATGAITVNAQNTCGVSGLRSLTVTRANPGTPGLISGPTNVCGFISPGNTAATYSVATAPGVTSYNWTLPAGATSINGQGTNTISFIYPAGYTGGSISVTASNGCGTSPARSLAVSSLAPATPSPIDVQLLGACPNRLYSYTLASLPANATGINWTVPAGATILTGQGTISITVSFPSSSVIGAVTAQSVNNCGVSVVRSAEVKLPACPPDEFTKSTKPVKLPGESADLINVKVFPNPSVSDFKLQVQTASKEIIHVRVLDVLGREYQLLQMMPGETLSLGGTLKAGSYILEVRQGKSLKTTKVLKF